MGQKSRLRGARSLNESVLCFPPFLLNSEGMLDLLAFNPGPPPSDVLAPPSEVFLNMIYEKCFAERVIALCHLLSREYSTRL